MTTAGKPDLVEELAKEIRDAIAGAARPEAGLRATAPASSDFDDVRLPIRRAEDHLTPTIPPAVRFARVKTLALRMLRFLWRNQASFNALALEAANGVVAALERSGCASRCGDRDQARARRVAQQSGCRAARAGPDG